MTSKFNNFLNYFRTKKHVTSQEMSEGLWMWCRKFSVGFLDSFILEVEKAGFRLDGASRPVLAREVAIIHLWMISRMSGCGKNIVEMVENHIVSGYAKLAECEEEKEDFLELGKYELSERYRKYDDEWDKGKGFNPALTLTMLEYMISQGQPDKRLLNIMLNFSLNTHLVLAVKALSGFCDSFKIVGQ